MRLCLTDQVAGWGLLVSSRDNYVPAWFSCNIRAQTSAPQKGSSLFSHVRCEDIKNQDVDGP